jgi:hypothetical protein
VSIESKNNKDPIDRLTSSIFFKTRCPKKDALTVFIPKDQEPSPEIKKILDEAGPSRWFPQDGGHLVKIPNIFDSYDEKLFKIEKDAWDHEHCDKCGGTIEYDEICWVTELENNRYLFCNSCYRKLTKN